MSVESIYKSYLYNQFLSSLVRQGSGLTPEEVEEYLSDNVDDLDLSVPQFDSADYKVTKHENASAAKFNNTIEVLKQDLTVLYKVFLAFGQGAAEDFERWKTEIDILDKRLVDLEGRIENLLLIAQDTEGYHSYFLDNLTDLFYVDLSNTNVAVDTASQVAFLSPALSTGQTTTKISLQGITDDDWFYKVRTFGVSIKDEEVVQGDGSPPPPAIFDQKEDTFWRLQVGSTEENKEVVVEVTVKISDDPIYISSIYTLLHSPGGEIVVTPLYSIDNYNFSELPSDTKSIRTESQATFGFQSVQAKWVKFILVREIANETVTDEDFRFDFGFREIEFYNEAFTTGESRSFISKPVSIIDINNEIQEFSKVALEVCEDVPQNTSINYFVTPGGSSSFSIDSTTEWYPISPSIVNSQARENPKYPIVLNLGDILETEIGDTETVSLSYDRSASDSDYRNPAQSFRLLSLDTDETIFDEAVSATDVRFVPAKSNEFILNYQVKDSSYSGSGIGSALDIDEDTVSIFRNVGEKGLGASNTVRGIQRGWRFEAPFYITLVEVLDDITIDFGDKEVVIDNKRETGLTKLKGKDKSFDGIHEVKVYKNNWRHVGPELNTLSELVAADTLYPYNHKLLVEGYNYGGGWLGDVDKVYKGVDLFFERRMKQISLFDLSENLGTSNIYKYFALDRDIADTHTGGNSATRVFVVKADDTNGDFINERFSIRFNLVNQRYSYLRFRADLETEDEMNSPVMGPYKLKFAE